MKNTKIKKRRNTKKYSKNLSGSAQPTKPSKPKSSNLFNRKKSYKQSFLASHLDRDYCGKCCSSEYI